MAYEFDNFLSVLCDFLVARAAAQDPALALTLGQDLFQGHGNEGAAAAVYSVVRRYDGGTPFLPVTWCSLQVETRARDLAAAEDRAGKLHACLVDAEGSPLQMHVITGTTAPAAGALFRIQGFELSAPAAIAVAENEKHRVIFNLRNLSFVKL
jgi:hypothetical protein